MTYKAVKRSLCGVAFDSRALIVFCLHLKISLWVMANRTDFRCFFPDDHMAAVGTFPDHITALGKDAFPVNIGNQFPLAVFMHLFNCRNALKHGTDLGKALFLCLTRKFRIHAGPLIVFPYRSFL